MGQMFHPLILGQEVKNLREIWHLQAKDGIKDDSIIDLINYSQS
jgi:hypothetical protein